MKIAVCIKQVPDSEARLRLSRDSRWLDEEDLPFIVNESDEYALEEGLRLAERAGDLADPAFDGGDALATGRALAAALAREGQPAAGTAGAPGGPGFDLVL